jgi:hypothetical protein
VSQLTLLVLVALTAQIVLPAETYAQAASGTQTIFSVSKNVSGLPNGPLFWRLETFSKIEEAEAAAGPLGLVAEGDGHVWLFTVVPEGAPCSGGTSVAEVGPLPVPPAAEYELRVTQNVVPTAEAGMPHMHPGPESVYVETGEVIERTASGDRILTAGEASAGQPAGTAMQLENSGGRRAILLFVLDAAQPFSTPATLTGSGV